MEVFAKIVDEATGKRSVNTYTKSSNYFSRYNGLNYFYNENDDKYVLATRQWLKKFTDQTRVTSYKVKKKDTYDSIALDYYNNPTYYWIICDYNRIIDPITPPKEGTILEIPSLNGGLEFESSGI